MLRLLGSAFLLLCVSAVVCLFSGWVGPNPHTCSSFKSNLGRLLSALKDRLIQLLLASLLQTSMWKPLAPCFLALSFFLSSSGFVFLFLFHWSCVSPPSSLCSTTTVTNPIPQLCLVHSISSLLLCFRVCVVDPVTSRA